MAHGSELIDLAVRFSAELDECTATGGANIDRLMAMIHPDAVRLIDGKAASAQVGVAAIRDGYLSRARALTQEVELHGVDVWGELVVCRLTRRDSGMTTPGAEHHLRILLVRDGRIQRILVVTDPSEDKALRGISHA
ncbi:hypothetical protein CLV30_102133 [Haloactinopolyspora alba]|uniref:SnoaL-like protein n=1 Tax=Haloactinopolyspora alba TaxID=648780 RepID=A0A2P8EBC9_9ACTN|nr:nuclear transport factor 2 family protein [Haloactinopolyspora alba]PSL06747.1 hypothetical protein CLV30_102133 [Haloactinopolyspora alba]